MFDSFCALPSPMWRVFCTEVLYTRPHYLREAVSPRDALASGDETRQLRGTENSGFRESPVPGRDCLAGANTSSWLGQDASRRRLRWDEQGPSLWSFEEGGNEDRHRP